jgi:hypothetical protein
MREWIASDVLPLLENEQELFPQGEHSVNRFSLSGVPDDAADDGLAFPVTVVGLNDDAPSVSGVT